MKGKENSRELDNADHVLCPRLLLNPLRSLFPFSPLFCRGDVGCISASRQVFEQANAGPLSGEERLGPGAFSPEGDVPGSVADFYGCAVTPPQRYWCSPLGEGFALREPQQPRRLC
ncbi:hypothetical protein MRX96_004864 [Rhipicephalus microplus]